MSYKSMVKAQLIDLLVRRDEVLAAVQSENAQLRADKARLLREAGDKPVAARAAAAPRGVMGLGELAREYCRIHNVRSVTPEALRNWSQSR